LNIITIPVLNGIFPRWEGGRIQGLFIDPFLINIVKAIGTGGDIFLCPYSTDTGSFYPVGAVCRIGKWDMAKVQAPGLTGLMATIEGRSGGKASGFDITPAGIVARGIEPIDLDDLCDLGYPVISGAGWVPAGGLTETRSKEEVIITIYGTDLETQKEVSVSGNVGRLIEPEKAHTIEHAIIRSLQQYALCTPKTLAYSIKQEAQELKASVKMGFKYALPEVFGVTASGVCGNPLTNMAKFYLTKELISNIKKGRRFDESLKQARVKTMSRLTSDFEISIGMPDAVLHGLKKGMAHDDTPIELIRLKNIIKRFPIRPAEL
jgi:hypothetical protein